MFSFDNLILPYMHLLAGICFIGLHIGIRANAVFYFCEDESKLDRILKTLKIQIYMLFLFLAVMAISAIFFIIHNISNVIIDTLSSTQWSLYFFASINSCYMYYQLFLCEREKDNKLLVCNEKVALIIYYFIPLNILISCIGVLFALIICTMI